jgi:NAD(P)-dependent dehydrogenase (short-subunit alcohol dehydrogenase family)
MSVLALKRQLKSEGKMRSGAVVETTIHHYQTPPWPSSQPSSTTTETLELTKLLFVIEESEISMAPLTSVLVTGANTGIGYECCKQLVQLEGMKKVILACRSPVKAETAKKSLEEECKTNVLLEILIIDVSNLDSVRKAVDELKEPIDGLVLNAGSAGGKIPGEMTEYGVTKILAINVLGHVLLVDLLLEQNKLLGTVVFSGTEASRGLPLSPFKKQKLKNGSEEEFVSILDGSSIKGKKTFAKLYGPSKLVGTFWMSSMARQEPNIRFVTMSPGGTYDTEFSRFMPDWVMQIYYYSLGAVIRATGKMHSSEVGAKRYIDALVDEKTYRTGVFYASKKDMSGEVCDQFLHADYLTNEEYQDNANTALHKFIK